MTDPYPFPELKTEEGYSVDIVRTYIPGDLCPHNVRTVSAQHLPRETYILREMLCGHISPGIYVRIISFFGFQLRTNKFEKPKVMDGTVPLDTMKRSSLSPPLFVV